jgi:ubiquinone/menaquinone biosynthesis C-methylase UbiE
MEYLPPAPPMPALAHGAGKYVGPVAANYDAKREQSPKWLAEQAIIEGWLDEMPEGSVILDAPVGTGRFLEVYARRKFDLYGLDLSADMLNQCAAKMPLGFSAKLGQGNVLRCGLPDAHVDVAVNCRITRWLSPDENILLMKEMQRVCRKRIIWTARVEGHIHARTVELFKSALHGWQITRNVAGYEPAYRILMAEPSC